MSDSNSQKFAMRGGKFVRLDGWTLISLFIAALVFIPIAAILWLAFFDARLANFSDGILTLDFLDSEKFATEHNYSAMRKPERIEKVSRIAQNILGVQITIVIK